MKDLSNQQGATATTPPPQPTPTQGAAPTPEPTPTPEPEAVEYSEPEEEVIGFQDEGPTFDGAPEFDWLYKFYLHPFFLLPHQV